MRLNTCTDALAGQTLKRSHAFTTALRAFGGAIILGWTPYAAHGDWTVSTEAGLRHDSNVGNAQPASDIVADSTLKASVSMFQLLPLSDGYSVTVGGNLHAERYHQVTGLNNASVDAMLSLKKKWGLGPFVPWARAGITVGRSSYEFSYRNAWAYHATLAFGRRIDERWNLSAEYTFEDLVARTQEEVVPGLSGDAYSQVDHSLRLNVEYALSGNVYLALGLMGRRGDVVSTTAPNYNVYEVSRALAEDPAFGPEDYAYRIKGTTYGFRVGINYSPTAHNLISCGFQRFDTRADGSNNYMKSIVEITWDHQF